VNGDLDHYWKQLYSHPTIQAVFNSADNGNVADGRQSMIQNNL
jgi:hypothetical protein